MNNGKVRIYELSRELNLDNKDILVICDQLNIAVKSHSSTITESEAERIRTAAEKYSTHQANAPKRSGNTDKVERKNGLPHPTANNKPNPGHKQQILQIKHHTGADSNAKPSGAKVAIPPSPPVRPQTASPAPMKQNTLSRPPLRPDQEEMPPEEATTPELEMEAPVQEQSLPREKEQPVAPRAEQPARPAASFVEKPSEKLAPKPVQPLAPVVEKPVLKKVKPEQPEGEPRVAKAESKPVARRPGSSEPGIAVDKERRPAAGPVKSVPADLNRPQRKPANAPVGAPSGRDGQRPPAARKVGAPGRGTGVGGARSQAGALGAEGSEDDSTIETTPEVLELKRPTPPRAAVKARKDWDKEEEEETEAAAKAGKAGAKTKRRAVVIEDDDDFEDELKELSPTVMVSLSVARPPKPKSGRPAQPAAAQAPATAKKKPEHKTAADKETSRRTEQKQTAPQSPETIVLTGSMTVQELANALVVPETEIIKKLFFKGLAVSITQTLDVPTSIMVAEEFGVQVETKEEKPPAEKDTEIFDARDLENLQLRPPVVTIMGHVDHGKTTLLDAIRATKVAQGEAGGITQHIGAYHVDVEHDGKQQQVVFLDTPGHEAFTAMRARGAKVTDVAILVVAADDGVRPQTIEAISHAKAAKVPIIVAINKIDKPEAQPDRVKQELTEYGLVPEEWGGSTIMVPVSAIQKENLDTLLEMILLVAEIEELQANPNRPAKGTVIEAHLDKAKGPTATLLVQNGTLRVGDTLVAGSVFGKVRAMIDDRVVRVESAGPSWAVEVLGLSDVPAAGDEFEVFPLEKEARAIASDRSDQQRQSRLQQVMASRRVTLNTISQQAQEGELKELNLILKADVQGSVEAILGALEQLPQNEVQIRVLLAAPGEVTETDVDLAAASGAVIVGFNTTLASGARQAADQAGVDVREYNIIYKLLDDIQGAMEGLLDPEMVEEALGQVEVRAVFPVGRGAVAGCYVQSGKAIRNCRVRVRRAGKVVHEGVLNSLKRMKDDVKEVNSGFECGIHVDKFNEWQEGDIIETYQMVSKRRTLSPA